MGLNISSIINVNNLLRYGANSQNNSRIVKPEDDLQAAYNWLKSSNRNGVMGNITTTNRRSLLLSPGTYTMAITVLMDTNYIDILPLVDGTVTISKSGNGMGFVLLPDIDAVKIIANDDRIFKGRFSRQSVSYDDSTLFNINAITSERIPITGIPSATSELSNEAGGSPLKVSFIASDLVPPLIFGIRGGGTKTLYSSETGVTGEWVLNTAVMAPTGNVYFIWAADDDGNMVFADTSNPAEIWYGTWNSGTNEMTFARAQKGEGNFALSGSTTVAVWSIFRTSSGSLLLAEYGTNGRYIYRSTDLGHTWTEVYDPEAGVITHWHGMGQLAQTGRIVATAGDNGTDSPNIYYSDNDGVTWAILTDSSDKMIQPVVWLDIGHPTKMLCGSDMHEGLFLFDVYSAEVTKIFSEQDRIANRSYFFSLVRNNGVIYAGTYDSTSNAVDTTPAIYATANLVDWSCIYRILDTADPYGIGKLLWFNDALHGSIYSYNSGSGLSTHLNITPPTSITNKYGIICQSGVTNQLTTEATSSFEDGLYGIYSQSFSGGTQTQVTVATEGVDRIPHGTKAVRWAHTASQTIFVTADADDLAQTVSTGDIVYGSVMVGVPTTGKATKVVLYYNKGNGAAATNSDAISNVTIIIVYPGEWKTLTTKPILVDADDSSAIGLNIAISVYEGTATDILIDSVYFGNDGVQPSRWQVGGVPRASTIYDLNWQTPEKATHIFVFTPFAQSTWYDIIGGDWYIRSWRVNDTIYAELYYDSDEQRFKILINDGLDSQTIESDSQIFKKGQPLIFVVQFGDNNDSNIHLSIGSGRLIKTISAIMTNPSNEFTVFGLTNILVRWGDRNAANGMNGTIYDIDFTGELSPNDLVTYIDNNIN